MVGCLPQKMYQYKTYQDVSYQDFLSQGLLYRFIIVPRFKEQRESNIPKSNMQSALYGPPLSLTCWLVLRVLWPRMPLGTLVKEGRQKWRVNDNFSFFLFLLKNGRMRNRKTLFSRGSWEWEKDSTFFLLCDQTWFLTFSVDNVFKTVSI